MIDRLAARLRTMFAAFTMSRFQFAQKIARNGLAAID